MGVVYRARDTKLERTVALKFLPPQWCQDDAAKQRFLREAQAASATNHRNICIIHDIEQTEDGQLFIVMAYYEGPTLKQRLEQGALPVAEAIEIAAEIAEGLAKAHAQGVVHRDIKPGNIIVTEDGVKILDFGLAKLADAALKLTLEGSTLGTVAYMSPEQARGEEADERSDIWALGVVLYEAIAGELPFKGAYPEVIFYAIKNEEAVPLARDGRDIPDGVQRIVQRALQKDPAARYQSARELAREIRVLQGRSLPLDLRTEPVSVSELGQRAKGHELTGGKPRRAVLVRAVLLIGPLVVAGLGAYLWVARPLPRTAIAIAPVANQSGFAEIDPYRLALTQVLVQELADSPNLRVLPYDRLLPILRRFLLSGSDVSSREAIQAVETRAAPQFVIVPTLLYDNGSWRGRAEVRNRETATNIAVFETDPVTSSLIKDTVYNLVISIAGEIQEHFKTTWPGRPFTARPPSARIDTLDAAADFERGVSAYEQLEYAAARDFFASTAKQDPGNPLPFAWASRVLLLMRQDRMAIDAADRAVRLVQTDTPEPDALFTAAVSAEARRNFDAAELRYRALTERYPDEAGWLAELAGFLDRRGRTADAIATYHAALRLDANFERPYLELCRLYSPTRLNDPANAKEHGRLAVSKYRDLGSPTGEGQALWCLTDTLRVGGDDERREAMKNAEAALRIFEDPRYPYNRARAHYYVGLAAESLGQIANAASFWEKSLAGARTVGNALLQPLDLMNLAVMYGRLGDRTRASDYYLQSSKLYEALGEQHRAAQVQANRAEVLIEYGNRPGEGVRDIKNALAVFQKLEDKNFEVFSLQILAGYYRNAGRSTDAERELNRALAIAKERDMKDEIGLLTMERGRLRFEMSDYDVARELLQTALQQTTGPDRTEARIRLGRTFIRLGDFGSARPLLNASRSELDGRVDSELLPLLHTSLGEFAYEMNDLAQARTHFATAETFWTDTSVDGASIEARAYQGVLDGIEGRFESGRRRLESSLEGARTAERFALQLWTRVGVARIGVAQRRFKDALTTLGDVSVDDERRVGAELVAHLRYWRAQALNGLGDAVQAPAQEAAARKLVQDLQASLPEQYRPPFAARRDIRPLIGQTVQISRAVP